MVYKSLKYTLFLSWMLISIPFAGFSQSISPVELDKLRYANSVLKIAIDEKDTVQIAEAYYLFGKIEQAKHDFQKSNEYFLKSLKIQESRGETYELGRLYMRLHDNESNQGHYTETFKYLRKAKEIFERNKIAKGLKEFNMAMGFNFMKSWQLEKDGQTIKPNLDSALHYYKKFESTVLSDKDERGIAQIRLLIGQTLLQKNDKKCVFILKQAMAGHEKFNQKSPLVCAMLALSNAYLKFGEPEKAVKLLKEAERQNKIVGNFDSYSTVEAAYVNYFQTKGDWKQAFEHLQKKNNFLDKVYLADRNGAVSKLNIEYETVKKDKLLVEQNKNISLQKRFLWAVGSFLILMLIVSYILFKLYKKNRTISRRNAILLKEQNHRVKNNLQVVSSLLTLQAKLLEEGKAKEAVDEGQRRVETMAILHRQLCNNQAALDKINMEIFIIELTEIIIESYGHSKVETIYEIPYKELDADQAVFTGLLINELVANACKYAFRDNEKPSLKISFYRNQKSLVLKVKDNGRKKILFKENTLEFSRKTKSFGMQLINMMVLQLNGSIEYQYQNGSEFIIKFLN